MLLSPERAVRLEGRLAQLVEHLLDKQGVTGSSPVAPTTFKCARAARRPGSQAASIVTMASTEDRPEVAHYPGGEALYRLRHSAAHVLATAVTELFPDVKVAGGPPVENGFYYDFARSVPFTPEDLERIEARMREIVAENQPFEYAEVTRDEARKRFEQAGETYKLHFLSQIPEGARVTTYTNGA